MREAEHTTGQTKRRMSPQRRRELERRRKRQKLKKQLSIIIPAAILVIAAVVIVASVTGKGKKDETAPVQVIEEVVVSEVPVAEAPIEPLQGEAEGVSEVSAEAEMAQELPAEADTTAEAIVPEVVVPEAVEAAAPVYEGDFDYGEAYVRALKGETTGPAMNRVDYSVVSPDKLARWPEIPLDALPILTAGANMTENAVCITVDDCFQAENLQKIVQSAIDNNGKITIFPIGKNMEKDAVAKTVKWAWENGMEIENHTYNHVGLYHYDDERMTDEMWYQKCKLSQVLGVNYTQHFFRPHGGDERRDQRVQAYAMQLGAYGIAHWSFDGSKSSVSNCLSALKPGQIYLFHTTDNDLSILKKLIPEIASRGYRLVTMNEMFGLPENETSDLSTLNMDAKPALEAFNVTIPTLKKTTYARAAAIVQQRLIDLGWMEGTADGEFGANSYMATGFFQVASGISANGVADPATQAAMFLDGAQTATPEKLADMKKKYAAKKK